MKRHRPVHETPVLALIVLGLTAGDALAQRYEENNPLVIFNGTWTAQANRSASGGGYEVSSTAGNTVTFTFTGDSIVLYRSLDTNGGQASATVDGNAKATFTFNFPIQRWQVPAVLDHLGAGQHTLVLTVLAPQAGTASNVYIDAFQVPSPFAATTDQQSALAQANLYRGLMGLPAEQLSTAIDLAAQAHADYNANTAMLGHDEAQGTAGFFVGAAFSDRMLYFGYSNSSSEVAAEVGATASVDGWITSVYHRVPFTAYTNTDVGFGLSLLNNQTQSVMDFGTLSSTPPANRVIVTYPTNNQTNIFSSWDHTSEGPDPLPGMPTPVGYPISLHISQPANPAMGTATLAGSGTLTGPGGTQVPVYYLDRNNDPAKDLGDDYFIIPQQPLAVGTTYQATISGTDTAGNQFSMSWSFTTGPASLMSNVLLFGFTANSGSVQWQTSGTVASAQLAYGTDTTYGTNVAAQLTGTNQWYAQMSNLQPSTTYHYQLSATDATGNTQTTADATVVTPGGLAPGATKTPGGQASPNRQ
jgi:uncharacterized protein YkwD